ncbi:MAG: peptidase E [Betaproteobacteria bacterium]|jgi:peptidase E
MAPYPKVIAVGGGGFTHAVDPSLEDFIVAASGCSRPRIGFIGTASEDDPVKIRRFYERCAPLADQLTHLPVSSDAVAAAHWSDALDIIYVGGGNTLRLIEHWRHTGLDEVFKAAARRGVLMAGVSAGANVWFDHALSDSGGLGLRPVKGIGLIAGSCCPHYDSEPQRQPAFEAAIAAMTLPDGVAVDDGVAVLIDGSGQMTAYSARPGAGAYRVSRVTQTGTAASASIQAQTALTAGTDLAPGRLSK